MSNFCGGISIDNTTLKLIDGIICDSEATTADRSKAVSTCGQLWDGALFTTASVGGVKVITLHNSEGEDVGTPIVGKGNCGVGLDGRFFTIKNGVVGLQDGFVLTVNVTPEDAAIKVTDVDGEEVGHVAGSTNQFLLSGIGDSYTVEAIKTGYETKTQTITNDGDQTIEIVLVARGDG